MASKVRIKIKMNSTAEGSSESFTTMKNPRNTPDKLELKRYDKKARKHVIFKEGKISK